MLSRLLHLLPSLGHPVTVFLAFHPLLQLVGIAKNLLLLVAEAL